MTFKTNKRFKRKYNRLFARNPAGANTFLLLQELMDQEGQVATNEEQLAEVLAIRFPDGLDKYALGNIEDE